MANEITVTQNGVATVVDAKIYNKNLANEVRCIQIKCRKVKTEKNTFNSVKGYKKLYVINEEGINEGKQGRWIDVHFTKDAFKGVPADCEVHSSDDLSTGYLYVKAKYIQAPRKYQVVENEETGELEYPSMWIKGGIVGFEAYVDSQDDYDYEPSKNSNVIEAETKLVEEEPETEETTI